MAGSQQMEVWDGARVEKSLSAVGPGTVSCFALAGQHIAPSSALPGCPPPSLKSCPLSHLPCLSLRDPSSTALLPQSKRLPLLAF